MRKTAAGTCILETKASRRVRSYRDLVVWQKAMELCSLTYRATARFPGEERFGLVSQMRRAAVSIPSNIAEGFGRLTTKDYQHFLATARGSARELETQILIASDLGYLSRVEAEACESLTTEVSRMLTAIISSLSRKLR